MTCSAHKSPKAPHGEPRATALRALHSLIVVAVHSPFLVVAPHLTADAQPPVCEHTPRARRRADAERQAPPRTSRSGRHVRPRCRHAPPIRGTCRDDFRQSRSPLSSTSRSGTTRNTAYGPPTALQSDRRTPLTRPREFEKPAPTHGTLPRCRISTTRTISPGTGVPTPASTAVPRFAMDFAHSVTSVAAKQQAEAVRTGLPTGVSFPAALVVAGATTRTRRFPPTNVEARGTHPPQLFPVRPRLRMNSLARAFAPLMVELFVAGGLPPGRRLRSQAGSDLSPGRTLPTPAALNGHGLSPGSPDPTDGIRTRFEPSRPHATSRARCSPVAPARGRAHRIERPDWAAGIQSQRDYSDEPPSNWTSTSRRIQLYRRDVAGGSGCPRSREATGPPP